MPTRWGRRASSSGTARRRRPRALLALGHGAGGDVGARDLTAVADAAVAAGVAVALITQPYRVAGRRTPAPAGHLDEAWREALADVRPGCPRRCWSAGGPAEHAACRTAVAIGASGIVALAFPEHPPGRPDRSRADELRTGVPTLVVNGDRDPFGVPPPTRGVTIRLIPVATTVSDGTRTRSRRACWTGCARGWA